MSFDYGGGYIWATYYDSEGRVGLYYAKSGSSLDFKEFSLNGADEPIDFSVDYQGNCIAVVDNSPVYFSNDGSGTGSAGQGLNGETLSIAAKNWTYALSTKYTTDYQNVIYEWQDISGGTFEATSAGGVKIAASYYTKS